MFVHIEVQVIYYLSYIKPALLWGKTRPFSQYIMIFKKSYGRYCVLNMFCFNIVNLLTVFKLEFEKNEKHVHVYR